MELDISYLKNQLLPGPFVTKNEVDTFMSSIDDSKEKQLRMYIEVRYARMTSMNMKSNAAIFRLRCNGKFLSTQDYADNLSLYLDQSHSVKAVSLADLGGVLTGLRGDLFAATGNVVYLNVFVIEGSMYSRSGASSPSPSQENINAGDHVASFWVNQQNKFEWYLGEIVSV